MTLLLQGAQKRVLTGETDFGAISACLRDGAGEDDVQSTAIVFSGVAILKASMCGRYALALSNEEVYDALENQLPRMFRRGENRWEREQDYRPKSVLSHC